MLDSEHLAAIKANAESYWKTGYPESLRFMVVSDVMELIAEIDRLAAAYNEEKARLDWLQTQIVWFSHPDKRLCCFRWDFELARHFREVPVREAIDAARKAEMR